MKVPLSIKRALDRKFEKVKKAAPDFRFFVLIHDFIEYIETTPALEVLLKGKGSAREKEIPVKYPSLKEVYQGIEDLSLRTNDDLGHDRFVAIRDLGLIRKNDLSENNSFWKRRESFRKITEKVYQALSAHLSETA